MICLFHILRDLFIPFSCLFSLFQVFSFFSFFHFFLNSLFFSNFFLSILFFFSLEKIITNPDHLHLDTLLVLPRDTWKFYFLLVSMDANVHFSFADGRLYSPRYTISSAWRKGFPNKWGVIAIYCGHAANAVCHHGFSESKLQFSLLNC